MMRGIALVAVLLVPAARLAADEAVDKALKAMEGDWKVEKMTAGGQELPAEAVAKITFTIKDGEITPSDNPADKAKLKLDPSKKPAHLDLTDKSNKTVPGIYEVSGETLKLCFADEPAATRPTEFASPKDSKVVLMVLKKAKK